MSINAQNLIPNPGFEEYTDCPSDISYTYKYKLVKDWESPTKGTFDYFNSCSKFNVGVPINIMGNTFANEGHGYVGLVLLEKPNYEDFGKKKPYNYREYIQCKLKSPLLKDSLYAVGIKYAVAEFSTFQVNRIGIILTHKKVQISNSKVLNYKPIVSTDTNNWGNNPFCLVLS